MSKGNTPADPILIVDDEPDAIQGCTWMLETAGLTNCIGCEDSQLAIGIMAGNGISLVLLDLSMPHISGEELLSTIVADYPQVPVIIVTGVNDIETAIRCMKAGASDYVVKPVEETRLVSAVQHALEMRELRMEYASFRNRVLSNHLENPEAFASIITGNSAMYSLFQYAETIALTPRPVLITGETGVGKELLARAIHVVSKPGKPFVAVNVAGLDDNMFSDTLFGHLKGAFTGADKPRQGLVERAAGGTLFLDEIGDLEPSSQIKLLRLLQEQEYFPLGADAARLSEVRIIVATNRDLNTAQKEGSFRTDLYYRIQTHCANIPPLRQRMDDIPLLVEHFLEHAAEVLEKKVPAVPRELFTLLANYSFPGNVRELEGMVFDAVSQHKSKMLSCDTFKAHIEKQQEGHVSSTLCVPGANKSPVSPFNLFDKLPTLSEAPRLLIEEAMARAEGNQTIAARLIGISRSGLSKALKRMQDSDD